MKNEKYISISKAFSSSHLGKVGASTTFNSFVPINKIAELKGLKSNRSLRLAIQKGKYILNTYLDFKEQLSKFGGTINDDFLEFYKNHIQKTGFLP